MTVHVTLGEPLWRERGTNELVLELTPGEPLGLRDLPGRLGLEAWASEGLLAVVNGRLVPSREADSVELRDGDRVVLQLLLAGG